MTAFICADIHSYYDEWMKALKKHKFDVNNENHILVVLGDLLDRGPKPIECLDFVNSLPDNRKILIRGNHEDLLEAVFERGFFMSHDFSNGTVATVEKLSGMTLDFYDNDKLQHIINVARYNDKINKYLKSCIDYFENDSVIFVHGWIPCEKYSFEYNPDWRKSSSKKWQDARWICGFDAWEEGVIEPNKTIWCGHWHTSYAHSKLHYAGLEWDDDYYYHKITKNPKAFFTPFADIGIVGMDACTAYSGIVNCKTISRFKYDNNTYE